MFIVLLPTIVDDPGEIIGCRLNAPGSWHDARVARPIYDKLRDATPPGYYLVSDTAFPRGSQQISGRIKAPVKEGTKLPRNAEERAQRLAFDRQLLSFRQTAEWGNRQLQGAFGRLRVPLEITYNDQRGDLLENCARLHNLRARRVGINQIQSVYMPIWVDGEQEQVFRNFETLLISDQRRNDRVAKFHMEAEEVLNE